MVMLLNEGQQLLRFIGESEDGSDDAPLPASVDDQLAVELYRRMVLMRVYDERSLVYHRHGRIGTYAIYWGHEAMQVGAVTAMGDDDWVIPSYRESAVGLMRGMSPTTILHWWRGHEAGWWNPQEWKIASVAIPVASQVPHAAGVAWGEKLQGRTTASLVFFGDGATSEGDFHEGVNFAAVLELPVVLLCNNNQWAITTPIDRQTKARTLADKAVGYGIPAVRVDGTDVLAVHQAVTEAVERGRSGGGPTFVECVSYRPVQHATADDPTRYREDALAAAARDRECVSRYEAYLLRRGLIDESVVSEFRQAALDLMAASILEAEAAPPPGPEAVFDNVYAQLPPNLAADRELLKRLASQIELED